MTPSADMGVASGDVNPTARADSETQGRKYRSRRNRPYSLPHWYSANPSCDACRRKKLRCFIEGDQRVCTLCRLQGIECTFVEQPVKRIRTSSKPASSPRQSSTQHERHISPQRSRMYLPTRNVTDKKGRKMLEQGQITRRRLLLHRRPLPMVR